MEGVRPWHIVLFSLALLVLGGSVLWQCQADTEIIKSTKVTVVDVVTGELFESPRPGKGGVMFPLENPDTKSRSMLPAEKQGEQWIVNSRYLPLAVSLVADVKGEIALDKSSGQVRVKTPEPVKRDLFGK